MQKFVFKVEGCQRGLRLSPNKRIKRLQASIHPLSYPSGVPRGINPRPNDRIDRGIYRDVKTALLNGPGFIADAFGERCLGMCIWVDKWRIQDENTIVAWIDDHQGLINGGHLDAIMVESKVKIARMFEEGEKIRNVVPVEFVSGLTREEAIDMSAGLSATVQVKDVSIDNLHGTFDWIKDRLSKEPYAHLIYYNEVKITNGFSVLDVIRAMEVLNIFDWPVNISGTPWRSYSSKKALRTKFIKNQDTFKRLAPILPQILEMRDIIQEEGGSHL